jgi:hypothetical protein
VIQSSISLARITVVDLKPFFEALLLDDVGEAVANPPG